MTNPQANDLRDCANGALLEFDLMASLNSLLYSTKRSSLFRSQIRLGAPARSDDDGTILQLALVTRNPRDLQRLQGENTRAQQACL
jgi:hypothetical protein